MRAAGAHALRFTGRSVALVPRAALALPPRLRRWLALALAFALVLGAAYLFWFRDSSFVTVDEVEVTGLTTKDAPEVRTALEAASGRMTTLNIDEEELMRSIANYPAIQHLEVEPDFPHKLRIHAIEHRPTAIVSLGDKEIPVAADGTILAGLTPERRLPVLRLEATAGGRRVDDARTLRFVRLLGAAPPALLERLEGIRREKRRGIVVALRDGPPVIFGDTLQARAKWAAATAVLANPGADGASYVDVRIPERPAAGGLSTETIAPAPPAGAKPPADPTTEAPAVPPTATPAPPAEAAPTN